MNDVDHDRLGVLMADLARSWTAPTDLNSTLCAVTQAAVDLIPGADSADILTIAGRHHYESHAPTSALPADLDRVQARFGEGPCVDAAVDGFVTRSDDLTVEQRWPRFTPQALLSGVCSIVSFRLYTHTATTGALNVLATTAHAFDDESIVIGEVLAAHAAIAITAGRREPQFRSALVSRDLIGQAKGMLMERFSVCADQAFQILVTLSQDSNTPVATVAERLVHLGPGPGPGPGPGLGPRRGPGPGHIPRPMPRGR
ncbi:ANTAR domain-containing protein [Rhodococcus opacus]|uniref:ANTAR domain-containing protein n=1 Tax=Rhodococcus opacus TaxID=37919 RepID=UPI002955061C|nr:ANTAR domain-containing protein [Rhodococcus opacus]MDV7089917.1 ANTAR domain-containing protein [Rhodococcus opacus]